MEKLNVRFSEQTKSLIANLAEDLGVSFSQAARMAVSSGIDSMVESLNKDKEQKQ
mgnify:CR=1 FL=1